MCFADQLYSMYMKSDSHTEHMWYKTHTRCAYKYNQIHFAEKNNYNNLIN